MINKIVTYGKIVFDPENKTNKHEAQASWKKVVYIEINSDICEYYAWFLKKRYNLTLNKPLRGAHVTIVNDSKRDFKDFSQNKWKKVKKKWEGKKIQLVLDLEACTDESGEHWWLRVSHDHRKELHNLRQELGLGNPFYGFHMTIGTANNKNIEHSRYIHKLYIKNLLNL